MILKYQKIISLKDKVLLNFYQIKLYNKNLIRNKKMIFNNLNPFKMKHKYKQIKFFKL